MPATNTTDNTILLPIFQKVMAPKVNKAYITKYVLSSEFEKNGSGGVDYNVNKMDFYNSQIIFVMNGHNIRPVASGYKDFINVGTVNPYTFTVTARPLYSSAQIPDFTNAITSQDRGAVIQAFKLVRDSMVDGAAQKENMMLLGDQTGAISYTSNTGSATTTIPVAFPNDSDRLGTRFLEPEMWISIQGATGGSKGPSVTQIAVNGVDVSAQTITVVDQMTFGSGVKITDSTQTGGVVAGNPSNEWDGITNLVVNTGTVQGQDVTKVKNQMAFIYNTAGPFDPNIINQQINNIEVGKTNLILSNKTGYNKMQSTMVGSIRTGIGNKDFFAMGYETFSSSDGGRDFVLEKDMQGGVIFGLDKSSFRKGKLQPFAPFGQGGGLMWIPGTPIQIIQMRMSGGTGCLSIGSNWIYSSWT